MGEPGIHDVVVTYRYLRVGLVALVALLLVSTLLTGVHKRCPLGSISAYFYTATHAAFIAALCAIGGCLIIYRGRSPTENRLLDFSGILAFVVAFVPTSSPTNTCGGGLPTRESPFGGVGNNVTALLIAALFGIALYRVLGRWHPNCPVGTAEHAPPRISHVPGWLLAILKLFANLLLWVERHLVWFLLGILVAALVVFVRNRSFFDVYAHGVAAILMFAGMIGVAILHACYAAGDRPTARRFFASAYLVVGGYMAGMVVAAALFAWKLPGYWTLIAEVALILGFAAFWILQTLDMWDIGECAYTPESLTRVARGQS